VRGGEVVRFRAASADQGQGAFAELDVDGIPLEITLDLAGQT
jgi:hypothetical protein